MDKNHIHRLHSWMVALVYFTLALAIYVQCFSARFDSQQVIHKLNSALLRFPAISLNLPSHLCTLILVLPLAITAQAKKEVNFSFKRNFFPYFFLGILFFVGSIFVPGIYLESEASIWIYLISWVLGVFFLHISLENLTKVLLFRLKDDIWNNVEESFLQNEKLIQSDLLFNLPFTYFYNRQKRNGWMNIDPFRALMIIGVPGSGKTESVIIPFIKQMLSKGFSMMVYDFKFPDLGKLTYYHYLRNKEKKLEYFNFHCINCDQLEYSRRINPMLPRYITTIAEAAETADAIVTSLQKTDKNAGAQQFFTQSAVNLLTCSIYFLAKYKDGKYSTLPHTLAFLTQAYDRIFNTLFTNFELRSLLAPFKSAYDNQSFDQLEGQVGTLRINLSKLVTKETFWVFSGNDFDLKISNPASVLVIANNPSTQNINSAFYSTILLRVNRLINTKGNTPCALVVDEMPTVFLHKIENLVATARSNKVAVVLGLQELPQLYLNYNKEIADSITAIMGTVLAGAVRNKDTLAWLEKLFGKVKQIKKGLSIDNNRTNSNLNENLDQLIPASKIASLNAGEIVGIVSKESSFEHKEFVPNVFKGKVVLDFDQIEEEKKHYQNLPRFYDFGSMQEKEIILKKNMMGIFNDVEAIYNL
ncbi:MAG: type IV secretory system conjugative DNA transfer family protein [Bacteroidetes bacterium]|nr:type IV secretory system conjugative DNA transfer family protein [Bacteroidota bacterium]